MRLTDEVARQVMGLSDPKKVWDKLDSVYLANNVPLLHSRADSLLLD